MQLPHELQHFPYSALIVASDTVHARFFLVGGDSLEELDGVAVPKETGQDGEGSMEFFPDDAARLRQFVHSVTQRIEELARAHTIQTIHFVMPAEIAHDVSVRLAHDLKRRVGKTIHRNVVGDAPHEIVRRIVDVL